MHPHICCSSRFCANRPCVCLIFISALEIFQNYIRADWLYIHICPFIKCIRQNNTPPIKNMNWIKNLINFNLPYNFALCLHIIGIDIFYSAPFNQLMTYFYPYEHNSWVPQLHKLGYYHCGFSQIDKSLIPFYFLAINLLCQGLVIGSTKYISDFT